MAVICTLPEGKCNALLLSTILQHLLVRGVSTVLVSTAFKSGCIWSPGKIDVMNGTPPDVLCYCVDSLFPLGLYCLDLASDHT